MEFFLELVGLLKILGLLFGLPIILGLILWRLRKKDVIKEFLQPNSANASGETLSISIADAIERLQKNSRPQGQEIGIILLCGLYLVASVVWNDHSQLAAQGGALVIVTATIFRYRARMTVSKDLLGFYNDKTPVFTLDPKGFNCPLLLLDSFLARYLRASGQDAYRIEWQNIAKWSVSSNNAFYVLQLREEIQLKGNPIPRLENKSWNMMGIRREFLVGQEQKILDFAQKFMPTPINPIPVLSLDKPWYSQPLGGDKLTEF